MKLMDKMTVGIIYALKANKYEDYKESVAQFMMQYSGAPRDAYYDARIENLVENAFAHSLNYLQYPSGLVNEYFRLLHDPWNYSHFEAMCAVLTTMLAVKEFNKATKKYEYINGFYPLTDFNFDKVSKE